MRAGEPVLLACQCAGRVPPWLVRLTAQPGGDGLLPAAPGRQSSLRRPRQVLCAPGIPVFGYCEHERPMGFAPLTLRPAAARVRAVASVCWRFAGIRWS